MVHQEIELVKVEVNENVELAKVEMAEKAKEGRRWRRTTHCRRSRRTSGSGGVQRVPHPRSRRRNAELGGSSVRCGLWAVAGGALAVYGRKKIEKWARPCPKTIEAVKEDVEWLKHQTS